METEAPVVVTVATDVVVNGVPTERASAWIDRTGWGPGPWQDEPFDKVQWTDEQTGLPCLAVRTPWGGNWCGYVGVPPGHPVFGLSCDDADAAAPPAEDGDRAFRVHGGLTFADFCQEGEGAEDRMICHVAQPGQPERVYWLGFDCAHAGDISPGMDARLRSCGLEPPLRAGRLGRSSDVYRTLAYVQAECADLASQLLEAEGATAEPTVLP